jgi:DNA-binding CsgD family transcriptional regulator
MTSLGQGGSQETNEGKLLVPNTDRSSTSRFNSEVLIEIIEAAPFVGIVSVDSRGHVSYIDTAAAEMLTRADVPQVIGRSLASVLSNRLAGAIEEHLQPGEVKLLRVIIEGWQLLLTGRMDQSGRAFDLVVQRHSGVLPERISGFEIGIVSCGSFGPLSSLTDRELEVAAWIGMGLSVRQISENLKRSIKTIENHRIALGRKLCVSDRLDIALIAFHAGLRPTDVLIERL